LDRLAGGSLSNPAMIPLLLSVQLYIGAPVLSWRVHSCTRDFNQWLDAAHIWAENSNVVFTGFAVCGPREDAPPWGMARVTMPEGQVYFLPLDRAAYYRVPLPVAK
jgi:hypothetical protein